MPGPQKLYSVRIKVSVTATMAAELKTISHALDQAQGEFVRKALEKHLKNMKSVASRGTAAEKREFRRKRWEADLELAWGAYLRSREIWWRQVKKHAPPQDPKLTAKRADLIMDSIEVNGVQNTVLSGKGVWLSTFHTERGFTGPEYAWRPTNIHKFSTMVLEERIGG